MAAQYYQNSGAYHPGANVTHAPAEGFAQDVEYSHHGNEAYTSVAPDQFDDSSDSYVTAGAEQYNTTNTGSQYGYAGQPGQPIQPGQSPQPGQPGQPLLPPQFSFENPVWRFWVSSEGISRKVIQDNISAFLGHDARVKPGPGIGEDAGKSGYWISAYRDLTPTMKDDLKKFTLQAERGIQAQPNQRYPDRPQGSRRGITPPQAGGAAYQAPPRRGHDPRPNDQYSGRQPNPHAYTQGGYPQGQDPQYYGHPQYAAHPQTTGEQYSQYGLQGQHPAQRPQPPPPANFSGHPPPPQGQYQYATPNAARPQYAGDYGQQPPPQQPDRYNGYNPNTTPPPTSTSIPPGYYLATDGQLYPQHPQQYNR